MALVTVRRKLAASHRQSQPHEDLKQGGWIGIAILTINDDPTMRRLCDQLAGNLGRRHSGFDPLVIGGGKGVLRRNRIHVAGSAIV